MNLKKQFLTVFLLVLILFTMMNFASCGFYKEHTTIKMKDIELNGIDDKLVNIVIPDGYPMYDIHYKLYEPVDGYEEKYPEDVVADEMDEEDIQAIYYPIVSEDEKKDFYLNRYGAGRALNVKVILRQENFDKRLVKNHEWYPYPRGVIIKGEVMILDEEMVTKYYKSLEHPDFYDLPLLLLDENVIGIDVKSIEPIYIDDYTVKVGLVVENNDFINKEYVKKGFEFGKNYVLNEKSVIYESERPIEILIKEVNNKEEAKKALENLYKEEKVFAAGIVASSEITIPLIQVAEKYKKYLFIENVYDESITAEYWNKYIYKLSPTIYQRVMALAKSFDSPKSKVVVITEKNTDGKLAYNIITEVVNNAGGEVIKHYSIDTGNEKEYDFSTYYKEISGSGASHLVLFWDINNKPTSEAIKYSPLHSLGNETWIKNKNIQVVFEIPNHNILETLDNAYGFIGSSIYHYRLSDYAMNDYLKDTAFDKLDIVNPDYYLCQGFNLSAVIFKCLDRSYGNFDFHNIMELLEDKEFETVKGFMKFRKEDHQALQNFFIGQITKGFESFKYTVEFYGEEELIQKDTTPPIYQKN